MALKVHSVLFSELLKYLHLKPFGYLRRAESCFNSGVEEYCISAPDSDTAAGIYVTGSQLCGYFCQGLKTF